MQVRLSTNQYIVPVENALGKNVKLILTQCIKSVI